MQIKKTAISGVLTLEPNVFGDGRGFFYESFNEKSFRDATGLAVSFVQDNHSKSAKNVLRGLHYQIEPRAQGKLIRVVSGAVFDVAVDIRRNSPTCGCWIAEILSAENRRQLWLPSGMAHGFLTLSDTAEFLYKTTDYYSPAHERCIAWNDPELGIDWPLNGQPILSPKDCGGQSFAIATHFSNAALRADSEYRHGTDALIHSSPTLAPAIPAIAR